MCRLSVIVRTCGRPWFLQRSLASISAQSLQPEEVIVVNDDSQIAGLAEAIESARSAKLNVILLNNSVKKGRGGSLNRGIEAASAELVAFLDDDDTWNKEFLRKVHNEFEQAGPHKSPPFGVVTQTEEIFEKPDGEKWKEYRRRLFNRRLQFVSFQELAVRNRFTNNAFVFPRNVFQLVGPYREDLPVLEDWEFNVRFAARFPIRVIKEPLSRYHKRPHHRGSSAQNTELALHRQIRHEIRDAWLRHDFESGKCGLGTISLLAELQGNRALRALNRLVDVFIE